MATATILLADDDRLWTDSMAHLLESRGYRVLRARTGVDALYQVHMRRPDLVLLNPDLPQLSGWKVCQRLRRAPEMAGVKVVLLTLEAMAAYRAGADGYLPKGGQVEPTLPLVRAFRYPAQGILGDFIHGRGMAAA